MFGWCGWWTGGSVTARLIFVKVRLMMFSAPHQRVNTQRRESHLLEGVVMLAEKKALSVEEIEAQTALELPDRELMLVTVIVPINVNIRDVDLAVQVCSNIIANQSVARCEA